MIDNPPLTPPAFFNPFPKYLQIRHIIERRLYGDSDIGDKLPTEQALCAEFGVSRETIREALRGLEEEGVIRRYRAKGTFFVHRPDKPHPFRATGMLEDHPCSQNMRAEMLATGLVKMPEEPAGGEASSEDVYLFERLIRLEDRPLAIHEAYLPRTIGERLAGQDLACTPLMTLIEKRLRTRCVEEWRHIDAVVADTRLARLLEIPVGAPVLKITRAHRLGDKAMRALSYSYYRSDRYYYMTEFSAGR